MGEWKKTACVLCATGCGLEAMVENNHIVRVRADEDNPRSQGYCCRKGRSIAYHQHHDDRLTHPLKRVGNEFVQISWDQALTEIADKLKSVVAEHGKRSFAIEGCGGLGCQSETAFGLGFLKSVGSQYYYNALAGELTGFYWGYGRVVGKQYNWTHPDHDHTDMLLAIGWNPYVTHQMIQGKRIISEISKDPGRLLVVIDPRRSETAKMADIHLAIRPGTDALLTRAMIAIILQEGWQKQDYIDKYVADFDQIKPWFMDFDVREACRVCELDYDQVKEVTRLFASRQSSLHEDLGVLMGRHSTLTSYLHTIMLAICGRLFVPGGNIVPGVIVPLGTHTDERNPKNWRTVVTDYPKILGMFPPNVLPEEINNDHRERIRAVIVTQSNPLRSFADTTAYEEAFSKLDLLVTMDIAMTETARVSDYVLPARTGYESWDTSFFQGSFPEIYGQLRPPIVEPEGEQIELSEMWMRLADKMGFIPDIPDSLYEAAGKTRLEYGQALIGYLQTEPKAAKAMPFIVGKTLGKAMDSVNKAWMWTILQVAPQEFKENAARIGFKPGIKMGDRIFQAMLDHPEGQWIGRVDPDDNFKAIQTEDKLMHLYIPDVEDWVLSITPGEEEERLVGNPQYPFILLAGRHIEMNINNHMRNPEWYKGRRACTLAVNPKDAAKLNVVDGQMARVTTEAGSVEIEVEITTSTRAGTVIIPQGFGLNFKGEVYGVGVNRLTKNTHRDQIAGTPLHRYVRCSVEAL